MKATVATLVAAVVLAVSAPAAAMPDPGPAGGGSPAPAAAGPGIAVGPAVPGVPPGQPGGGGAVDAGGADDPGFFDIPGQIRAAIDDWFRGLVEDALGPVLDLLGHTVLATPQVAGQERVLGVWLITVGVANALLVLFVIAGGVVAMTHETLQTRYAIKEILPRLVVGAVAANASLAICQQMIALANELSAGILGGTVDPAQASAHLDDFISGAIADGGIFLILLGLVCAVMAVVLLVLYVIRAALVVLLAAVAPLMLLAHALPQTEPLARLWWRCMLAALGVQVAQALALGLAIRVFFAPDGRATLGLGTSGGLMDLVIAICVLWLLVKIPLWAKELAFTSRPSIAVKAAKTYVMGQVARAAA